MKRVVSGERQSNLTNSKDATGTATSTLEPRVTRAPSNSSGPMHLTSGGVPFDTNDHKRFTLKLVLVAATASFLFGFNVSLLNTAYPVISSDLQLCGRVDPEGYTAVANKYTVDQCKALKGCFASCMNSDATATEISCPGGYKDIGCKRYKWYQALVTCALLVGAAAGAIMLGRIRMLGRRYMLLCDCAIFAVGVAFSVCSNSLSALTLSRLVVGFGVGIVSVLSPTYISEVTPAESRGYYGVFHQVAICIGILVGNLIGLPLINPAEAEGDATWRLPTFQRVWWRFMLGLGIVPVLVAGYLLLIHFKNETPVWYVEQHRDEEAKAILRKIHNKEDVDKEYEVTAGYVQMAERVDKEGLPMWRALAHPRYRNVIMVGIILSAFQQLGGVNVFMTSSNTLFKQAGLSSRLQTIMSIVMATINLIMTFPTLFLIEMIGRKTLLFTGSLLQTLFLIPAAIAYLFEADPSNPGAVTRALSIIGILGFVMSFAFAFGPVLWVYLFEIYPIEIKAAGSAGATAANWIFCIVIVFLGLILENIISFSLFAILQLLATIFIAFKMKETKGRALGDSPYMADTKASV